MKEIRARRPYHSPQRQEQAQLTRTKILEAARRLFRARGYAATTLPAIAREAGVAAPTITAVFGAKAALLEALIDQVLGTDSATAPAIERPWWREMLAEPDPQARLRVLAANARIVQERGADVYAIVRGAATADPEFAAIMRRRDSQHYAAMRTVAESLAADRALAPGLTTDEAADVLWALSGPEMYRLIVVERGWSGATYERWLASSLLQSLLAHADR